MKPSLFLPKPQPVVDWDNFKQLNTDQSVPGLDIAAINARLAPARKHPFRYLRGTFRVPDDASIEVIRIVAGDKIKAFISAKEKQGWTLVSRPEVHASRFERTLELDGSGGKPGMTECVVRARFRKMDFRPLRIEVEN